MVAHWAIFDVFLLVSECIISDLWSSQITDYYLLFFHLISLSLSVCKLGFKFADIFRLSSSTATVSFIIPHSYQLHTWCLGFRSYKQQVLGDLAEVQ